MITKTGRQNHKNMCFLDNGDMLNGRVTQYRGITENDVMRTFKDQL